MSFSGKVNSSGRAEGLAECWQYDALRVEVKSPSSPHFMKEVAYFSLCFPYTIGRTLQPLRSSNENRSETHTPDKDATLTDGVLSF